MYRLPCRYVTLSKSSIYRHRARARTLQLERQLEANNQIPWHQDREFPLDDYEMEENISPVDSEEENSGSDTDSSGSSEADYSNYSSGVSEADAFSDVSDCASSDISRDEDDPDISEDENINDERMNEPFYPGARVTLGESITCILKYYLRHNSSDSDLADLLVLVDVLCPEGHKCPRSLYLFRKLLGKYEMPLKKNFHCSECFTPLANTDDTCAACPEPKSTCYFISIPVEAQLKELFDRPRFYDLLSYRFTRRKESDINYEDIYDGNVHRNMCSVEEQVDLSSQSNISFTWNSDGVPLYTSSKFSIWPSFCMMNELPPEERIKQKNMILSGLWFGVKKPHANLFLKPLQENLQKLEDGIDLHVRDLNRNINVKVKAICSTCDLVAKAIFLNMKQHNGRFGCHKCKIETVSIGRRRSYQDTDNLQLRTTQETEDFAAEAYHRRQSVLGVKGPSIMSLIFPDFIRNTTIDPMHLLMGLVKLLLKIWTSSEYRDHPASLSVHFKTINDRMGSITPPSFVERLPRKIDDLAHWKASELIIWLLMYSTMVLNGVMSEEYLSHHKLLVFGVYLLYQKSISPDDINKAQNLLHKYVAGFSRLYGAEYMTCNLHSLLHLSRLVEDYGPLWVFSCFPFENANGILKSLVHATRNAQIQICKGVSLYLSLDGLKQKYIQEGSKSDNFYERLDKKAIHRRKLMYVTRGTAIVGRARKLLIVPREMQQILLRSGYNQESIYSFHCLLQNGIFYSARSYIRRTKTNSSCVEYVIDNHHSIGIIETFIRVSNCTCKKGFCAHCAENSETLAIVKKCNTRNPFSTTAPDMVLNFIYQLETVNDESPVLIDVSQLQAVYFQVNIHGTADKYGVRPFRL